MATHEASQTPTPQPQSTPAPLTSAWLKAHFDPLPFPARTSALSRYARALTEDAYGTLREALAAGTPDERHTGLFLAVARRDLTTIAEALTDPLLRRRALSAAIRLPVPDQALEQLALSDLGAARRETYRILRLSRRHTLAARLLPQIHERFGAHDAARLLPACPAETVGAWLPRLDPPAGVLNALTRTAPLAVAHLLVTRGESGAARDRHRFVGRNGAIASVAAERDPEAGLLLLARAPDLLTPRAARTLLRRPDAVLEILRATPPEQDGCPDELRIASGPLPPATRRAVSALPPTDLLDLARRCPATPSRRRAPGRHDIEPDGLLMLLPAPERRRLVEERTARRGSARSLPVATLAALEPADRAAIVTPWVERASRSEWTSSRLAVALPLALGEPVLRDMAGRHRVHHRLMAWPALLACAELEGDPAGFARIAEDCERAWHDQEEVRRAALQQLAGAPPRLLAALPDRVLRDATLTTVQSRDSTTHTLAAAEQLLRRTAQSAAATGRLHRAAYATELLCHVLSDPRFHTTVTPLRIDEEAARAIWAAAAASDAPPTRPDLHTALAELLAPHLTVLPELDALVRELAWESDDPDIAARAAAAWVRPAELRERRSAELVSRDASFASVPVILRTVVTRRTDLLDSVLRAAREGLTGRVRPRAVAWAAGLHAGVTGRWLPEQRSAWDDHHARVAADESAPLRTRADAAAQVHEPGLLTTLAESAPQPVAAAALGALGEVLGAAHDGAPPATEPLLNMLLRHAATGGVRGRAAMASVRRLLEVMPDPEAVALLTPVACAADAPVGTRKEAVRALGALAGDAAFDALVAAWDAPRQHRDVRAVVARHLLAAIDRPAIADRLARATDEPAVREAVIHARVGPVRESAGEAYADFLAGLVRDGDEETVVAACRALPAWFTPGSADAMRVVADVVTDPERRRREWNAAAQQLACFPPGPAGRHILTGVIGRLQERAVTPDPQGRADALRRLCGIAEAVRVRRGSVQMLGIADTLAAALRTVGLYAEAAALTWDTSLAAVRHGEHCAERWERLLDLVEERPERLPLDSGLHLDVATPRARAAHLKAARLLRERGTPTAGVMALALVRVGGRASSWEEPWRAELAALREHADHDTAMAAFLLATEERP